MKSDSRSSKKRKKGKIWPTRKTGIKCVIKRRVKKYWIIPSYWRKWWRNEKNKSSSRRKSGKNDWRVKLRSKNKNNKLGWRTFGASAILEARVRRVGLDGPDLRAKLGRKRISGHIFIFKHVQYILRTISIKRCVQWFLTIGFEYFWILWFE